MDHGYFDELAMGRERTKDLLARSKKMQRLAAARAQNRRLSIGNRMGLLLISIGTRLAENANRSDEG